MNHPEQLTGPPSDKIEVQTVPQEDASAFGGIVFRAEEITNRPDVFS